MKNRAERALELAAQWPLNESQKATLQDIHLIMESMQPDRDEFLAGVCVALGCVTAMDYGVLWEEIVKAVGADALMHFARHIEPEEWELAGFSKYVITPAAEEGGKS